MLCTKLSNECNLSISTVEHLMAAFIGFGIDNALVEVDCSELPILDGSSSNYIKAFNKTGLKYLDTHRKVIHVLKKVSVNEDDRCPILVYSGKDLTDVQKELLESNVEGLVRKDEVSMEELSSIVKEIYSKEKVEV